jgi:TP901-1 family phage major tail protein
MAAYKGSAMLLKIGATPSGSAASDTYTTIAGLRSTSITHNEETVDVTNKDSSQVRELLAGAGVYSVSISGSGILTDNSSLTTLEGAMNASDYHNFQVVVADFGTYEGEFAVTSFEIGGEYNGEITYSITLESAGTVEFA